MIKYGSVCSGIEAASVAWEPLGFEPQWFSEIEPFPSAVLAQRFLKVENRGDMTRYKEWPDGSIDILVGGTPCQSFSVAGLRKGLSDPRGNLVFTYLGIVDRFKPKWIVWENVPGVLSSNKGRDFGYGFAYRVLDAQYFGVPQRRKRVFVVGYFGDWRPAASVLFERESLRRDIAPGKEKRKDITGYNGKSITQYGEIADPNIVCMAHGQANAEIRNDNKGVTLPCNHEDPIIAFQQKQVGEVRIGNVVGTLNTNSNASGRNTPMICIPLHDQITRNNKGNGFGLGLDGDPAPTLTKAERHGIFQGSIVRRLTPKECERLQGFPDDWTKIPWRGKEASNCPDGPRYKACGNSMAVPVMRWIGERILLVENTIKSQNVT